MMPPPENQPQPEPEEEGLIVGLDAATPVGSVALATADGRLLATTRWEGRAPVSKRLLAEVARLLDPGEIDTGRIKAIAVTHGPGTFTGLRVGLAVAKTLAHGWGAALYGYSTLEIMARRWPVAGAVVCVLLDARRGELYSGVYRLREAGRPELLREDRVEPAEALLADLERAPWPEIYFSFCGAGAASTRERFDQRLGARARWISPPWNGPGAEALALAGAADWTAGVAGIDPLGARPVYLRASDAEKRHPITAF